MTKKANNKTNQTTKQNQNKVKQTTKRKQQNKSTKLTYLITY